MRRRKTLDKKTLRLYSVAFLAVLIIATFSGCTEDLEEPQDTVNIYVYEEMGGEGDPQEQIREFYGLVEEQAGPPVPVPVAQYAVELDPDTGDIITIYDPETKTPIDPDEIPPDWDSLIVKDDAGNFITDASKLDLHIKPIGENKYQILNLKQELEDEDGGIWRVKGTENPSFDKSLVDNIITVGDKKDDMYGALVRGSDGNVWGVIFVDEDVFDMYDGDFGIKAKDVNPKGILKKQCTDLGGGLYAYLYNLSEMPEDSARVCSPHPYGSEQLIADKENNGKFAQFRFVKESS